MNLPHPELELASFWESGLEASLQPVYSTTEKAAAKGLNSRGLGKLTKTLLQHPEYHLPETLNAALVHWLGDVRVSTPCRQVHAPQDQQKLERARRRLKFEELFFIQLQLLKQKQLVQQKVHGERFEKVGTLRERLLREAPAVRAYERTEAGREEVRKDMGSGRQMKPAGTGGCRQRKDARGPARHR
jgi:ATP-dependent DNA helicase RecG